MPNNVKTKGKSGPDIIVGTALGEHLNGGARADVINGLGGSDRINSGAGNDIVNGGAGSDIVDGNSGRDIGVYVAAENKDGNSRFADYYDGGSGIDTLRLVLTTAEYVNPVLQQEIASYLAFIQANTLPNGQAKNVEFTFSSLNLTVTRFEALELIVDGRPVDPQEPDFCITKFVIDDSTVIINGTDAGERIVGTAVAETVFGGPGDDNIAGRGGDDQLSGGDGNDVLAGDIGNEILCGGRGNDVLLGNFGNDQIFGGEGNDTLFGGRDDDVLDGGIGNDLLVADEGDDVLFGGLGQDIFMYGLLVANPDPGNVVIKDFTLFGPDSDRIDLTPLGANFDTFAEVISAATQTSQGVLFEFGVGRSLLVENVDISDFTSAMFIL